MSNYDFLEKVKLMPAEYQKEIKDFIDFVWEKKMSMPAEKKDVSEAFGSLRGKITMLPGFDDPIDGMEDYM